MKCKYWSPFTQSTTDPRIPCSLLKNDYLLTIQCFTCYTLFTAVWRLLVALSCWFLKYISVSQLMWNGLVIKGSFCPNSIKNIFSWLLTVIQIQAESIGFICFVFWDTDSENRCCCWIFWWCFNEHPKQNSINFHCNVLEANISETNSAAFYTTEWFC